MRAPYNTTCDLYHGPGAAAPGLYASDVPCRLVEEDGVATIGTDAPHVPYYLTLDGEIPFGAWAPSATLAIDPVLADQVAVPAGGSPNYWVLLTDEIDWRSQPVYYRSYLVPLPLPGHFSHTWDFTASDGGWTPFVVASQNLAVYSAGNGWSTTDSTFSGLNWRYVAITRADPARTITKVQMTFNLTKGSYFDSSHLAVNIGLGLSRQTANTLVTDGMGKIETITGSVFSTGNWGFGGISPSSSSGALSGSALLTRLTIEGLGTDPF